MPKAKRIFVIADFKDELAKSIRMQQRMWVKGFLRLGHDVQRFSYRNIMMQFNPFPGSTSDALCRGLYHYLERFDKDKKCTAGYFAEASKKKE